MSDWEKVEQYVRGKDFHPTIPWDSYIACMLLYYQGDIEENEMEETPDSLDVWLFLLEENYRLEDFDYE